MGKAFDRKRVILTCFIFWVVLSATFVLALFMSKGYAFKSLFFRRTEDFIMDFANSIRDSSGNDVYTYFESLYPPIAVLFFRFLSLFYKPEVLDRTITQYKMWNEPMLHIQFSLFVFSCYFILFYAINRKLKSRSLFEKLFVFLFISLSYPFIYSIERGNIILFSTVLIVFFVCCYKDDNKIVHELSIFALALSIATKLYPVVFALVLIKGKDIKSLVKAGIYSSILLFVPFCFYGGIEGFLLFAFKPFSYFSRNISASNTNIKLILYHAGVISSDGAVFKYINYLAIALFCLIGLVSKKKYITVLCCQMALLSFTGAESIYATSFMFPTFVLILHEEKMGLLDTAFVLWYIFEFTIIWLFDKSFTNYLRIKLDIVIYPLMYLLIILTLFDTNKNFRDINKNKNSEEEKRGLFMNDYNENDKYGLNKYHTLNLEVMDEIDRICKKYDIKYILVYGSLIGAARHNGFIPWDDDLDIAFLREEFTKFMSHTNEIDKKFRIVDQYTYENKFWDSLTRLVYVGKQIDQSSELTQYFDELHNCIFVDLFVFDDVKDGISFKMQSLRNKILYGYAMSRRPSLTLTKYDSFFAKASAVFLSTIGKLFKLKNIIKRKEKNMVKNNGKGLTMCSTFNGFPSVVAQPIKKSYFEDTIEMDFEGRKYSCPREYDEMLQIDFGDWRIPPKEEERVGKHHNMIL